MTVVRRILDNAAARSLATRHAEAWYVATVLATAATSWALLTIARALTDVWGRHARAVHRRNVSEVLT